jgi:hypothetical protein
LQTARKWLFQWLRCKTVGRAPTKNQALSGVLQSKTGEGRTTTIETISRAQETTFAFFGDRAVRLTVDLDCPRCGAQLKASDVGADLVSVCSACRRNLLTIGQGTERCTQRVSTLISLVQSAIAQGRKCNEVVERAAKHGSPVVVEVVL